MKKAIIALMLVAVGGWAVWYFFIREKTLGEKIDATTEKVEDSIKDAVDRVTR